MTAPAEEEGEPLGVRKLQHPSMDLLVPLHVSLTENNCQDSLPGHSIVLIIMVELPLLLSTNGMP